MNFSVDESSVRVDLFKPSGKWSETVAIIEADYTGCVHESVKKALNKVLDGRCVGYTAVCLEPCHELGHPISFVIEE